MSMVEGLLQFLKKVNDIISNPEIQPKKRTHHNLTSRVRNLDIALKNVKVDQKVREFAVAIPISSPCRRSRSVNQETQLTILESQEKMPELN